MEVLGMKRTKTKMRLICKKNEQADDLNWVIRK